MIGSVRGSMLRVLVLALAGLLTTSGCSTAPRERDRETFITEARAATGWFERNVSGLREQIDDSAGDVVFPSIGQFGIIILGGEFGRGMVCDSDGRQVGWGAINTGSLGLQAGVQGFKMLVVFEDEATFRDFQRERLTGSASAVAVAGEAGGSAAQPFTSGVAIYQGANKGLMAGVNIGLDLMQYEELGYDR